MGMSHLEYRHTYLYAGSEASSVRHRKATEITLVSRAVLDWMAPILLERDSHIGSSGRSAREFQTCDSVTLARRRWRIRVSLRAPFCSTASRTEIREEHNVERRFTLQPLEQLFKYFSEVYNYTLSEAIDISLPNPFAIQDNPIDNRPLYLNLVDNSESGQALPLWAQIQPARSPDFM